MKDIKLLYESAKTTGLKADIDVYTEAINKCLRSNPYQYASNIEYIILSSNGVKTFKEFFDTYGIPIISYNPIMESLDEAIKKCSYRNINSDIYKETKAMLESFRERYQNAFIMFESYSEDMDIPYYEYLNLYYKKYFESNISRVLSQFGEVAIPDVIIKADRNGNIEQTLDFLSESVISDKPAKYYQWLLEVSNDIENESDGIKKLKKKFTAKSLKGIVDSVKLRNAILYRESVLMNEDRDIVYSESEIEAMKDFIAFKEYFMSAIDDSEKIFSIQNEIMSVYEEFDGIIPETESVRSKKLGNVPDYLKKYHDLSYGEDNEVDNSKKDDKSTSSETSDIEIPHSEYLRKSTNTSSTPKLDDESDKEDRKEDKKVDNNQNNHTHSGPVNNYYYTYTNSFNRDNSSHHTDNSIHIDSHDYHDYDSNDEKTESFDITLLDQLILEFTQLTESFTEGTAIALGNDVSESKPSVLNKLKEIAEKIIDFLIDLYYRVFPKTILHFEKLRKKYNQSSAIQKYCNSSNNVIVLSDVEIDNINILGQLIKDAKTIIREEQIRINSSYNKYRQKERVVIFYTNLPDMKNLGFFIVSSNRAKSLSGPALSKLPPEQKLLLSALPLSENSIFNSLTSESIPEIRYNEFKNILWNLKLSIRKFKTKEGTESYKRLLTELNALSKNIHMLMNTSYRSAINLLKSIEHNPEYSVKEESTENKFTLDIFNTDNIIQENSDDNIDPEKPTSDHPVRDTLMDIDRRLTKKQQEVKKTVQDAVNVGKTFIKPAQRTAGWIDSMVHQWKDTNENKIKEKMADPRARKGLYQSIKKAIVTGSLFKAGLLLNPIFLFLAATKKISDNKNTFRIRNEMIGELKAELEVIDEKIKDADANRDNAAKYKLIRLKQEIQKKLLRVEGGKKVAKII